MTTFAELKKMNKMNDEQLDQVAGGSFQEAFGDVFELYNRGLIKENQEVEQVMHSLGYTGYKANAISGYDPQGNPIPDVDTPTVYVNKQGKQVSREEFWQNFDKENNL
jgi:hypothetical protein